MKNKFASPPKSPIARWVGSKARSVPRILPLLPACETFCEVFGGAAHMTYAQPSSRRRVVNDLNPELINAYKMIARYPEILASRLFYSIYSRRLFRYWLRYRPPNLLDRALRFLYLNRVSFNARLDNASYAVRRQNRGGIYSFARDARKIIESSSATAGIEFVRMDFEKAIDRFDSPTTLFYLDPPYYGREHYYGKGLFARRDFARLASRLATIQGKFLLSINPAPSIEQLFAQYERRELPVLYNINNLKPTRATELVFANYPLPDSHKD